MKETKTIKGATVSISTDKDSYTQGELVTGEVIIATGEKELKLDYVVVGLWEGRPASGLPAWSNKVDIVELSKGIVLPPYTEQRFPFRTQLPKNCRLSVDKGSYWELAVMTSINVFQPEFQVTPAREFVAIVEACVKNMPFVISKHGQLTWWENKYTVFAMDSSSHNPYDNTSGLIFDLLLEDDGGVKGYIYIDMKRHMARSLPERIKAFIVRLGPIEKKPFELKASQIFLPDGKVNHSEITKVFNTIIDEVVASRSGP